jgi:hypothetical protein
MSCFTTVCFTPFCFNAPYQFTSLLNLRPLAALFSIICLSFLMGILFLIFGLRQFLRKTTRVYYMLLGDCITLK